MSKNQFLAEDDTRYHYSHLAINKSRLKSFNIKNNWNSNDKTYYLDDGSEFQVELFNPTYSPIAAEISINGKSIGSSMLVIYPGQRIWLERYFDSNNRFKFIVYDVEANNYMVDDAIKHNGEIKIKFYKEKTNTYDYIDYNKYPISWTSYNTTGAPANINVYTSTAATDHLNGSSYTKTLTNEILGASSISSVNYCLTSMDSSTSYEPGVATTYTSASTVEPREMKETGIVGKSDNTSSQRFRDAGDIEFEYCPWKTETLIILPMSQKRMTIEDANIRRYCTKCGKKLKQSFKYCPVCGTKIE